MRSDMMKVLCERPRRGGWTNSRKGIIGVIRRAKISSNIDFDSFDDYLPTKIGMKAYAINKGRKVLRCERKDLNENLNPLWRFLYKNCGQPWSEVYSEMREMCDARSAIGYHIFQHALDSWGFGWVHDCGLTRENYHVPYKAGYSGYGRTLNVNTKIGYGDFVVEDGILYGPPITQGIPVPKKLRNLIRTENVRNHRRTKKVRKKTRHPREQTQIAVEKMIAKKRETNARRNFAKFMKMSEKTLQQNMDSFKVKSVADLKKVLVG